MKKTCVQQWKPTKTPTSMLVLVEFSQIVTNPPKLSFLWPSASRSWHQESCLAWHEIPWPWGGESVKWENGVLHPFMTPSFGEIHWQSWIGMEPFLVLSKLISLLLSMDYQSLVVCQVVWSSIEVSTKNLRTCDPKTRRFQKMGEK